ncbi:hypothetical protein J3R08_004261 [Micromonospora sp. HB375]|nr:hypothetical protein [Micromonospora sp. HB375]MDH6471003.1 hypothetical protein [Micromonospora sp. H404/HB375]
MEKATIEQAGKKKLSLKVRKLERLETTVIRESNGA